VLRNDFAMEVPVVRLLKGITVDELARMVVSRLENEGAPVASTTQFASAGPGLVRPAPAPVAAAFVPAADPALAEWTPVQRVARAVVTGFTRTIANVRVEGAEHAPDRGGFVIAANHVSMWDAPVLLCAADRPVIMFAAERLRQNVFMHWTLHKIWNAIYLRRGEADLEALEQAVDVVRRGGRLGLSPEGHRSRNGLQAAHTGVAYLAYRAGVPTLPVAVYGQERIVTSWRRLRRAPVHVRIGAPVPAPSGDATPDALRAHTERVMLAIARLLPREYRGRYAAAVDEAERTVKQIA
jgi:1-acyl-sn-glycerol-3-phosphate acyltransferase